MRRRCRCNYASCKCNGENASKLGGLVLIGSKVSTKFAKFTTRFVIKFAPRFVYQLLVVGEGKYLSAAGGTLP